jgi:hypothetical protein
VNGAKRKIIESIPHHLNYDYQKYSAYSERNVRWKGEGEFTIENFDGTV